MKDFGAEYLAGREGVQLFGLLNLYLEQEQRFQPREKGLSLIEATPEVSSQERYLAAAADGAWGGDFKNTCVMCVYTHTHRHIYFLILVESGLKAAKFLMTKIDLPRVLR